MKPYPKNCPCCDLTINTEDMFEPACKCISKVEDWSDEKFREEYETLPHHIQKSFRPPNKKDNHERH